MRFDNSSLFVNTGRKPLPAMQKKKKSRSTIFIGVCIAIISVLCVFVGLIVRVWINYDKTERTDTEPKTVVSQTASEQNDGKAENEAKASAEKKDTAGKKATDKSADKKSDSKTDSKKTTAKKTKTKKTATKKKTAKKTAKKTTTKKTAKKTISKYTSSGTASVYSEAADKCFENLGGTYAYGITMLGNGYSYINNVDKLTNSSALSAFLVEYICAKIYTGEFDYNHNVGGYTGNQLIEMLTTGGSVEAANLLIGRFTPAKINAYMQSQGYTSTHFGNAIGDGSGESCTTIADLSALMQKLVRKNTVFPYSDLYGRMKRSKVNTRIRAALPQGTTVANISSSVNGECFDAGVVYTPSGNFIFIAAVNGYTDDGTAANTAIAGAAKALYDSL